MRRLILTLVLVAAACGGDAATDPDTPTTTTTLATTTTAPSTTTTVTVPAGPTELPIRAPTQSFRPLSAGADYIHSKNIVPIRLTFEETGWALVLAGESIIALAEDTETLAPFFTFTSGTADALLDELGADSDVRFLTEPAPDSFAGRSAMVVDLEVPTSNTGFGPFPCNGPVIQEEIINQEAVSSFLVGCSVNRMWLIDLEGGTLVIHFGNRTGSDGSVAQLEPHLDLIAEFEAAITIGEES